MTDQTADRNTDPPDQTSSVTSVTCATLSDMTATTDHTQTIPDEHVYTVRFIREAMAEDGMDWRTTQPTKRYCMEMALHAGREKCGDALGLKLREWVFTAPEFPDQDLYVEPPLALVGLNPETDQTIDLVCEPEPPTILTPAEVPASSQLVPEMGTDQTTDHTDHQLTAPDQTTQTADHTPDQTTQTPIGNLRFLPPLASLGLSAIMQVIIVTDLLGTALKDRYASMGDWAFIIALIFGVGIACALEGSAAYVMDLYKRHLLAKDSTFTLRIAMLAYVGGSAALIHWWTDKRELPAELSVILSVLAGSSLFLWTLGSKWENRVQMRANGQLDPALPRLAFAAKFWHPLRWLQTIRLTSWDPVQTTDQARARYAVWSADRQTKKSDRNSPNND